MKVNGYEIKPYADLKGANLVGANLSGADLVGANLEDADLVGANLEGAFLWGANLKGANLYNANLQGANLWGANLVGANLWGANLKGADLAGADLKGANLKDAILEGADVTGTILEKKEEPKKEEETIDMTDKNWEVMNSLQESFNEITAFSFMLDKLQEAVDANDTESIVDITAALNAYYPVYTSDFDKKFQIAWCQVVKGEPNE